MTQGHLSDDRLIALALGTPATALDRAHLLACLTCETRRIELTELLGEATAAAARQADEAFPAERLARQQQRILQRLDHEGRPGRLITFPAGHHHEFPAALPARRRSARWMAAAAAAAGLTVGLFAGQLTNLPGSALAPEGALSSRVSGPLRPAVLSDDEFLGQLELAVGSATPAVLNPLDALTPGAWDVPR